MGRNGSVAGTPVGEGPEFDVWLDQRKDAYRRSLDRLLENVPPGNASALETVFSRMRTVNEGVIEKSAHILGPYRSQALRGALEDVFDEYRPAQPTPLPFLDKDPDAQPALAGHDPPELPGSQPAAPRRRPSLLAFVVGAIVGVAAAIGGFWLLAANDYAAATFDRGTIVRQNAYQAYHVNAVRHLGPILDALRRIEAEVTRRQQEDAQALAQELGQRFVDAEQAFPEIAGDERLPRDTRILIRADAQRYKILANSPICNAVKVARPSLVDPVRDGPGGCRYFGIWNAAGAPL